jgi:hypothetical protein
MRDMLHPNQEVPRAERNSQKQKESTEHLRHLLLTRDAGRHLSFHVLHMYSRNSVSALRQPPSQEFLLRQNTGTSNNRKNLLTCITYDNVSEEHLNSIATFLLFSEVPREIAIILSNRNFRDLFLFISIDACRVRHLIKQ